MLVTCGRTTSRQCLEAQASPVAFGELGMKSESWAKMHIMHDFKIQGWDAIQKRNDHKRRRGWGHDTVHYITLQYSALHYITLHYAMLLNQRGAAPQPRPLAPGTPWPPDTGPRAAPAARTAPGSEKQKEGTYIHTYIQYNENHSVIIPAWEQKAEGRSTYNTVENDSVGIHAWEHKEA